MYPFNRILVCLDLSDVDDQLIKAASALANHLDGKDFYFLHVVESLELPSDLLKKYGDLIAPVDENVNRIIEDKIEKNFINSAKVSSEIIVREGNTTDSILRLSQTKEIDLIIMGKKEADGGSGMLPQKIVKICHCSFLLVPYNSYHGLTRILVPLDFSENSKMAFEQAKIIAEKSEASIICHHSYKVPSGYHATGKSYAEFAEIMRTNAVNVYHHFLESMGYSKDSYPCIFSLTDHGDASIMIHETAVKENMDLIVMSSKGRTGLASILLGSVAMKTVKHDLEVELLVVKGKEENMGFLEALLNL